MVENSRAGRKRRKRGRCQLGNRVSNGVDVEMHRICVDFCPSWGCSLRGGNFMIWGRQLWPGTSLSWTAQAVGTHTKFLTSRGTPMGISGIWAEKEHTSPEWITACSHYGGAVATQSKRLTHVNNCQNNLRILNYGLFLWVGRIWGEKWKIFFYQFGDWENGDMFHWWNKNWEEVRSWYGKNKIYGVWQENGLSDTDAKFQKSPELQLRVRMKTVAFMWREMTSLPSQLHVRAFLLDSVI